MDTFATWAAEIDLELTAAVAERDAALLEQSEADRAEAVARVELVAAQTALDRLARRIEAEAEIEQRGAVVLRPVPTSEIATALRQRLDELRQVTMTAATRARGAGHALDASNNRITDLRRALDQLGLLQDEAAVAHAGAAA